MAEKREGLFSRVGRGLARGASAIFSPETFAGGARGLMTGLQLAETGSPILAALGGALTGREAAGETRQAIQLQQPIGRAFPSFTKAYAQKTGIDFSELPMSIFTQSPSLLTSFSKAQRPDPATLGPNQLKVLVSSISDQQALLDPELAALKLNAQVKLAGMTGIQLPQAIRARIGGAQPGAAVNKIRVKLKATGQTGTIPANEFNPALYERF